jgi:hypothetical protein
MPEGYVTLIGSLRQVLQGRVDDAAAQLAPLRRSDGTRRSMRQRVFDGGGAPLPGYEHPAPRHTGWEAER